MARVQEIFIVGGRVFRPLLGIMRNHRDSRKLFPVGRLFHRAGLRPSPNQCKIIFSTTGLGRLPSPLPNCLQIFFAGAKKQRHNSAKSAKKPRNGRKNCNEKQLKANNDNMLRKNKNMSEKHSGRGGLREYISVSAPRQEALCQPPSLICFRHGSDNKARNMRERSAK